VKKQLVLALVLAVISLTASRTQAQSIGCSNLSITGIQQPVQTRITYSCTVQGSASQSSGVFSTAGSGQVPRIPQLMTVTFSGFDVLDAIAYQVTVRDAAGNITQQYAFGFGCYLFWPTVANGDGTQTATVNTVNWPQEFTLELMQWHSFAGSDVLYVDVRLYN